MSPLVSLFRSSIGRKFLMAVTGVVLIGFIVGHLVGNLQIFEHPDRINGYAVFLRQTGPLLWVARIGLLACVVIHIWAATVLTLENKRARGGQDYAGGTTWIDAAFSSRYMRSTGYVVLAFIIYHLAQFTWGATDRANFKENLPLYTMQQDYHVAGFPVVKAGTVVPNVYRMVYQGFESAPVALFYLLAVGLLSLHLLHGADSLFQTFGWRSHRWAGVLRRIVALFCLVYFLGNLAIPGSILTGLLPPNPAAQVTAHN
ncbi:MAG: succinate dehydrogenase cytochrome b subunit [Opitutales bacterium]